MSLVTDVRPVRLRRQKVDVRAPRELCFEVVATGGRVVGSSSDRVRVVEFETDDRGRRIVTRELLRLHPPDRIEYEWLEGPLPYVREEISFEPMPENRTRMRYSGEFSAGSGPIRFLSGLLLIRPRFNRLVREHLEMGKDVAERRTARTHLHRPG